MSDHAYIDIVFDASPGPVSGRFVEVEDPTRKSIRVGKWIERDDGYWVLRLTRADYHSIFSNLETEP